MARIGNKYVYLHVVQGNYGCGWEDLTVTENYDEARRDYRDYRENETGYSHRLVRRRVLNQNL